MTALYCIEIAVVLRGGLGLHVEWILLNKGMPTLMLAGKLVFAADIVWNLSLMAIKVGERCLPVPLMACRGLL